MSNSLFKNDRIYSNTGNRLVIAEVPTNLQTVLDVGCGAGDNAKLLQAKGLCVDGITLSEAEAELARPYCRRVFIHDLDDGLPANIAREYDVCICSHVLEHLRAPEQLLEQIRAVIVPQRGIVIVALPNIMMWRYRMRLVIGRFEYTQTGTMDKTHLRWFTFHSAQRFFSEHGFAVERTRGEGAFPLSFLRRWLPKHLVTLIDSTACCVAPGLFALQMVFTLSPREHQDAVQKP